MSIKSFYISLILLCSLLKNNLHAQTSNKLEIIKIDSTIDHFVFKTKSEAGKEKTVLVEKLKVNDCRPFKKFILADSIHQTSTIKSGKRKDIVGFYLSNIDGIKIRDSAELVKIVWGCNCFIDK